MRKYINSDPFNLSIFTRGYILTHSSQPQVKLPIFQQKTANEIHEIQHTLTLPLDSRLNPGTLTGNSEILKVSLLIFMNGQNHFQLQHSAGILDS